MTKEYWTLSEVIEIVKMDEGTILYLEEEEIVCPECVDEQPAKRFSAIELEKLRLAKVLMEDMDVNLPGVEVILRMRENMIQMRRQFDAILEDLAGQFKESLK
jgi:MerR family transcriptional regulator, heat shock protein HspR